VNFSPLTFFSDSKFLLFFHCSFPYLFSLFNYFIFFYTFFYISFFFSLKKDKIREDGAPVNHVFQPLFLGPSEPSPPSPNPPPHTIQNPPQIPAPSANQSTNPSSKNGPLSPAVLALLGHQNPATNPINPPVTDSQFYCQTSPATLPPRSSERKIQNMVTAKKGPQHSLDTPSHVVANSPKATKMSFSDPQSVA
jgi:hypothetical protein